MTIKELREEYKRKISFNRTFNRNNVELADFYETELKRDWEALEELYKENAVHQFSDEILALANGIANFAPDYSHNGITVLQTLDLHAIYASKKFAKELMMAYLHIGEYSLF